MPTQETVEELRENGVNHLEVKTKNVTLTKDNLDDFVILDNRRDIKAGVKNKLKRLLMNGEHFETPMMCSLRRGKFRILDGNHRREALKEFFDKYPNRKVEVIIHYYEGLTDEEEKEKYTKWNLGTKQSVNDMVKQYWVDIEIIGMMEESFPCTVSHRWGTATIEFKTLVASYLTRDTEAIAENCSADAFIDKVKDLSAEDYRVLKAFMTDYVSVFGQPDKDSTFYKQVIFWNMFRIWYDNKSRFTMPVMLARWKKQLVGDATVKEYTKLGGGTTNLQLVHGVILARLNAGASVNKYV